MAEYDSRFAALSMPKPKQKIGDSRNIHYNPFATSLASSLITRMNHTNIDKIDPVIRLKMKVTNYAMA